MNRRSMYKSVLAAVCLSGFANLAQATVSIEVDAGLLQTSTGAIMPVGGLLELIASPSGVFGVPTSASFVTGDNVILRSFAASYTATGTPGEIDNNFTAITLQLTPTTPYAGEAVLLRWYPSLTTASASPGANTLFGQFRAAAAGVEGPAWVVPADGGSVTLLFNTISNGGPYANALGQAITPVTAAVPEPSTNFLLGFSVLGLAGMWLRKSRLSI